MTDEPVYKITVYLTFNQWCELSAWSAPRSKPGELGPWLLLFGDGDMQDEYKARLQELEDTDAYMQVHGKTIYETRPITSANSQ